MASTGARKPAHPRKHIESIGVSSLRVDGVVQPRRNVLSKILERLSELEEENAQLKDRLAALENTQRTTDAQLWQLEERMPDHYKGMA